MCVNIQQCIKWIMLVSQTTLIQTEISQQQLDVLQWNSAQTFMVPRKLILLTIAIPFSLLFQRPIIVKP